MASLYEYVVLGVTTPPSGQAPAASDGTEVPGLDALAVQTAPDTCLVTFYYANDPSTIIWTGPCQILGTTPTGFLLEFLRDYSVFDPPYADPPAFMYQSTPDFFISQSQTEAADIPSGNVPIACFLQGTHILARQGYIRVESLAVGDEILTLDAGWQPIVWVGRQVIFSPGDNRFHDYHNYPIRIQAGAFGADTPSVDLWVSPEHAVFFRGHLIPAKSLVNGTSVIRDTTVKSIEYFHVLLNQHQVIFSEGLPTESFVPMQDIGVFENSDTFPAKLQEQYCTFIGQRRECYPRMTTGVAVEAARGYLAENLAGSAAKQMAA